MENMEQKEKELSPVAAPTEEALPRQGEQSIGGVAAAWDRFFSSLSEGERATLLSVLDRLSLAEKARREAEARAAEEAVMDEMEAEAAFHGIRERADVLHALIDRVDWLRALPLRERLAAAMYLDRGMRLHEPTPAEKLESVLSDPALLRALAERQAALAGREKELRPPVVRGRGGARMPANLPKEPRNLQEAGNAAMHYFKIRK